MPITSACGHHCGLRSSAENTRTWTAHCDCAECHDGTAPVVISREDLTAGLAGTPMCARWYELAGAYRPWQPPHEPHVIRDDRPGRYAPADLEAARDGLIRRLAPPGDAS